jgi:excisionase family DNA binding protein
MIELLKSCSREELLKIQGMVEALLFAKANGNEITEPESVMTVEEAAIKANCSTSLIYSEISTGKLDAIRYAPRCVRISSKQLNKWLAAKGWVQSA